MLASHNLVACFTYSKITIRRIFLEIPYCYTQVDALTVYAKAFSL